MHILVLPVSGNKFPVQMGLMSNLLKEDYDPDLIFGSSGGAVTAISALGGDWSKEGMYRIIRKLKPELFLQSWWPSSLSFIPSWSLGFFRGSVYDSNETKLEEFFSTYFTPKLLTQKELWIGVSNETKARPEIFCNRSQDNSQVSKEAFVRCSQRDTSLDEQSIHYLNGNTKDIQTIILSSASIPTLIPPQKYQGSYYSDGGTYHASPLSAMHSYLQHRSKRETKFHITYLNTCDIEDPISSSSVDFYPGIFKTGALTFGNMITSSLSKDRSVGIDLIHPNSTSYQLKKISLIGNPYILNKILTFREKHCDRSFLELFVSNNESSIDLQSFTSDEVLKVILQSEKDFYCRFWWYGKKEFML